MSKKSVDKRLGRLESEEGVLIRHGHQDVTVALVYPNTYYVGMSNLGYQFVYRLFNAIGSLCCERAFLPDREEIGAFERGKRKLASFEGDRALKDFDIIAFSVPFENDYPNILKILALSGIPLLSAERDEKHPLVIAGGVTSSLNPEPVADFIDLFAVGEGEVILPEFIDRYRSLEETGREELLNSLSQMEGVYVPSLYAVEYDNGGMISAYKSKDGVAKRVKRKWLENDQLGEWEAGSSILTEDTEFGNMYLLEVGRGCGRGCRFCAAGFINLPPRERSAEDLEGDLKEGMGKGKTIGLISPSLADHPDIRAICKTISEGGGSSSLSAVRADRLSPDYLRYIGEGGQKTVTIAPEAGTERLREVINKGLSDDDIMKAVETIAGEAIPNIRLYFMIGLPTEREEDIEGIADIAIRCRDIFIEKSKVHGRVGNLTLSVNSFVPKPFTPFQWHPMEEEKSLDRKLKIIKKKLAKEANLKVINDLPRWAHIQGLLSRGDRRVGSLLFAVQENGGDWKKAIREAEIVPADYTTRQRTEGEIFPWEVLDMGLDKEYLWKEYQRGLTGKITPPCNIGSCTRCGVC